MERDESASPPERARGYPILLIALVTFTTGIATLGGSMLGAGIGRAIEGSRSSAGLVASAVMG